jgi:hypothetical protein
LRDIAVTMVEKAMPLTGSMIALPIAIAMLRKNRSLPPMKKAGSPILTTRGGACSRAERGFVVKTFSLPTGRQPAPMTWR